MSLFRQVPLAERAAAAEEEEEEELENWREIGEPVAGVCKIKRPVGAQLNEELAARVEHGRRVEQSRRGRSPSWCFASRNLISLLWGRFGAPCLWAHYCACVAPQTVCGAALAAPHTVCGGLCSVGRPKSGTHPKDQKAARHSRLDHHPIAPTQLCQWHTTRQRHSSGAAPEFGRRLIGCHLLPAGRRLFRRRLQTVLRHRLSC